MTRLATRRDPLVSLTPMIPLLLGALAFAGQIVVQAEVPVEVTVDGRPTVQVFTAARVAFAVALLSRALMNADRAC